jgi:hypothetical protein
VASDIDQKSDPPILRILPDIHLPQHSMKAGCSGAWTLSGCQDDSKQALPLKQASNRDKSCQSLLTGTFPREPPPTLLKSFLCSSRDLAGRLTGNDLR